MRKVIFISLLVIIVPVSALLGCRSTNVVQTKDLVVVEQTDTIRGNNVDNQYEKVEITMDVPVKGPQALVDSVVAFLNQQLYQACERNARVNATGPLFTSDELFTDDGEQLLAHYVGNYESHIRDSLSMSFGLKMKMLAQTEKYVTYGLEVFSCEIGCDLEKYFYTFDKRDGRQVRNVITYKDLVRFFDDYPEFVANEDYLWKFTPDQNYDNSCYGLLGDHFSLCVNGWENQSFSVDIPYGPIFSYLSSESQTLVKQDGEDEPMLPAYLPERSEDGEVWMEVDTVHNALLGTIRAAGGPRVDTLMHYEPELEIYPKRVHSLSSSEGSSMFLFIYSLGHQMYCDEAMTCTIGEAGLQPVTGFSLEEGNESVISCMWYDQLVAASDGFPFYEFDENRFGIHFDRFTNRLYVPIMEHHDSDAELASSTSLQYTARYNVLQFNGKEFVPAGTDGAWWLNKALRSYKRTVNTKKSANGIEQTDLMPDGTYRHTVWKGANTLDDLRKTPDEMKVSKLKKFK